jgi:hypothetical protein
MNRMEKDIDGLLKYGRKITCVEPYTLMLFIIMGGCLFMYGMFKCYYSKNFFLDTMPEESSFVVIGFLVFLMFSPLYFIFYLIKICSKQDDEIKELKARLDSLEK